jgi:GxxExxY protein
MEIELKEMNLKVGTELPFSIKYRERKIADQGFRIDLLVEDTVIVELKSVKQI